MPVFTPSPSGITLSDLVEETRRHLLSGQGEMLNQLTNSIGTTDTTFTVNYSLGAINQLGALLAIDLEEILVLATDGNLTVTSCIRAVNGSTAAVHAEDAIVTVRPKFSNFRIARAINEDIADLSSPANGMFQVIPVDLTYNAAVQGYDITDATAIIKVLEARYKVPGPSNNWPYIREYSLQRNMPTSTWPSGFVFDTYQRAYPGLPIHLQYAAPYGTLTYLTDDITEVAGLQATASDIPPLGAAIRLAGAREIKRNFTEAGVEPRRAEEVPPGSVARSPLVLMQLRTERIHAEAAALLSQYPVLIPSR